MAKQVILGTTSVKDALKTMCNNNFDDGYDNSDEVQAARDGEANLLAQVDSLQETVAEVEAARDGEANLLAQIDALQSSILAVTSANGSLISSNDTTPGFVNGKLIVGNKAFSHTDAYTVTAADLKSIRFTENSDGGNETLTVSTQVHTNKDESADATWTLPAGTEGDILKVRVVENYYIRLDADGTETFRYGASQSAAGGYIRSDVVGTAFTIEFMGGEWVITSLEGQLYYDE